MRSDFLKVVVAAAATPDGSVGIEVLAIDALTGKTGRGRRVGGSHRASRRGRPTPHIVRTARQHQRSSRGNHHLQKIRTHIFNPQRKIWRNCSP